MKALAELLAENTTVLRQLMERGVDPLKKYTVNFSAELPSVQACIDARKKLKDSWREYGGKFIVVETIRSPDPRHYLTIECPMELDPMQISEIELKLNLASLNFGGKECAWEFEG